MYKIIHHSIAYIIARGVPGIINVIALALYTRFLTAEEYGHYAIALAIVVFLYSALFQWIVMSLSRFYPQHHKTEGFLKDILLSFLFIIVVTLFISMGLVFFLEDYYTVTLIVVCTFFLWGYAWFELTLELIRCQFNPVRYGIISITKASLTTIISFLFILYGIGVYGIILGNILSILLVTLIFFKTGWFSVWKEQKNLNLMKELIHYGIPLIPTTSLTVVVMSADRLLLGWFLGAQEAGLYATSYDLTAATMYLSLMAIFLASYPFVTKALETGVSQAHQQLKHYLHILLAIALPASTGFALLAPNISFIMLGEEFWAASTELIPWISLIALITGLRTFYFDLSFQLGKNTKKLVCISIFVAILSVGLNVMLIPSYGRMAVIYVGVVSTIVGCFTSWFIGRKVFPLPGLSWDVVKIFLASLGMFSVLWPIRHLIGKEYFLLQIGIGIFSYGTIFFILNIVNCRTNLFQFKYELIKK